MLGEIPIKHLKYTLGCLSLIASPLINAADLSDAQIKEVLIIGTKEEKQNLSGSGFQISNVDLSKHGYTDLNQIVSSVPGVYVREEDGFGLRPNIGIRGATSDRSQKITIMEDGVLVAPALGYRKIAKRLNEENIKTSRGNSFYPSSVYSILKKKKIRDERLNKEFQKKISKFWFEYEID